MGAKPILSEDELAGIREKPKRANENILNLQSEINTFLKVRPDPVVGDDEREAADKVFQFWATRQVPPRFSVIAGEVVHHLRSCLDHIAWSLSSQRYRDDHERWIGFPVMVKPKPWNSDERRAYDRQVDGILATDALRMIDELQPCHAGEPTDDPLAIIHELDRIDKHPNLVLVIPSFNMNISLPVMHSLVFGGLQRENKVTSKALTDKVQVKITPHVSFRKFGKKENQSVIPSLTQLSDALRDAIKLFAGEI